MRVISCFLLKYFGCLCGGVIAALFRTSTSAQLCCFLLRTHSMPDSTSCICIPYREVHYRQSVEIQQEIAIPDPLREVSILQCRFKKVGCNTPYCLTQKCEIKVSQNAKFLQNCKIKVSRTMRTSKS